MNMAATTDAKTTPAANKIKLFQLTQQYYHDVGIFPLQLQSDRHFNWKNVLILCACVVYFISMSLYFFLDAKSMKEFAITFYGTTTVLAAICLTLINIYERDHIFQMIEKVEDFIEKHSQNSAAQIKYNAMNKKNEKISKLIYMILIKVNIPIVFLPTVIICIANYYIYDLGEESFYLPCPLMTPFSWKTPFGFISVIIFETLMDLISIAIAVPNITYFFGLCRLFICILKISPTLKRKVAKNSNVGTSDAADDTELKKDFSKMVQFYSDIKELINDFNAIYEFVYLVVVLWELINIASGLLVFESESSDLKAITPTIFAVFTLFGVLFIFCNFGELVTAQFERFNRRLYRYKWYSLTIEMQKMYLIFVANTQQPVILSSFARIECTRETLKKTSKVGFSYFTSLRHIRMQN